MFADVNRKNFCVPLITYVWVQIDFQLKEHVHVTELWKRMTRQTSYQPQQRINMGSHTFAGAPHFTAALI